MENVIDTLKNIRNNPYGIKDKPHTYARARQRSVDLNLVNEYLCSGSIVGIEKSLNKTSIFQILYKHTKKYDLCIVINILNEEEIEIITLIEKNVGKRRHYVHKRN